MKIKLILTFLLFNCSNDNAFAAFMIDTMTGYSSSTDSQTSTNTSDVTNHIFIGASLGAKQRFYVGQNVTLFNHSVKKTTTDKINTLELGPRVTYFFSEENVFYTTFGWNPYAKGKRTIGSTTEEISGFGLLAGIGAELKINRNFHIGGSLNYKSLSITKAISTTNVATTESDTYTSIMPMLNLSFRFR